jgi:serine/threonine protein kinase
MKKPTLFGKYFLLERINAGGMAEVFRAKAFGVEGFERLVAVKRILPHISEDEEFIRMFIEEAKLAVQLTHANIAQIFDLGVVDGAYFIALEHVHGRDLRGIFDRGHAIGETMPIAQACFIAMKVCEGLDYAHNKRDNGRELQLVHRDVSPQNILVSFEGEVKLIDFGVAKAASSGSATQAGILKGKFGYMSPEQVRGLAVDRRSDVFSCGIVLYELLTGERLFVGESDFSTLEKVRNVEILPPSTYNRRIPDELERIVLKALAKDVEDRYQNAIDLHDELQAFVYTAGEFYSRKDLAGWMKKTFAREIEDETARIDGFRDVRPPAPGETIPAPVPTSRSLVQKASGARKPTVAPPPITRPPPPPAAQRSQPVPIAPMAISASAPTHLPPATQVSLAPTGPSPAALAAAKQAARPHRPVPGSWEDDDLETRVYNEDDARYKSQVASLPLQPPSSTGIVAPAEPSRVAAPPPPPAPPPPNESTEPFERHDMTMPWDGDIDILGPTSTPGPAPAPAPMIAAASAPTTFPNGSSNAPSPLPPDRGHARRAETALPINRELSAPARLVAPSVPAAPVSEFGARITGRRMDPERKRSLLVLGLGSAAIAAVSVVIALLVAGGGKRPVVAPAPVVQKPPPPPAPPAPLADPSTGFDLYVSPNGVTQWRLDGELRTDRLPSRIRGIVAGPHTVQIEPPPGFLSQNQQIMVEQGKAPKVEISLSPINGINGNFDSVPPGATVSLIVDGKRQLLGTAPVKAPLDPRSAYKVLFEKPGYVSVNRPILLSGSLEEHITVNLEKDDAEPALPAPSRGNVAPSPPPAKKTVRADKAVESDGEPQDKMVETGAMGVLVLGSKPPCEIAIDGASTGQHTPQKDLKLPIGRHRVTLSNSEFNIRETFAVDIKADEPAKVIKDYSDRLP